jgi:hypothetical protein
MLYAVRDTTHSDHTDQALATRYDLSTLRNWGVYHTDLKLWVEELEKATQPVGRVSVVSHRIMHFTTEPSFLE